MAEITDTATELHEGEVEPEDYEHLVHRYLKLKASIADLEAELHRIGEAIVERLGIGSYSLGEGKGGVRVQAPTWVFNAAQARKVLTADQYNAICELKPSAAIAKQLYGDAIVDLCKVTTGKPVVKAMS